MPAKRERKLNIPIGDIYEAQAFHTDVIPLVDEARLKLVLNLFIPKFTNEE